MPSHSLVGNLRRTMVSGGQPRNPRVPALHCSAQIVTVSFIQHRTSNLMFDPKETWQSKRKALYFHVRVCKNECKLKLVSIRCLEPTGKPQSPESIQYNALNPLGRCLIERLSENWNLHVLLRLIADWWKVSAPRLPELYTSFASGPTFSMKKSHGHLS